MQSPPMGTFDSEGNYTPRQITERDLSQSFADAISGTLVELKDGQLVTGTVAVSYTHLTLPTTPYV